MGSVERRLQRLEARTPPARTEEEVRAAACRRMSTEDLTLLAETCRRLEGLGWDEAAWEKILEEEFTEEERAAFAAAWGRYEEAVGEARHER